MRRMVSENVHRTKTDDALNGAGLSSQLFVSEERKMVKSDALDGHRQHPISVEVSLQQIKTLVPRPVFEFLRFLRETIY